MKIIGIDPATTSGWSFIVDGELKEFGQVTCPSSFTLPQQLNLYHVEFTRLIDRLKPDYCAIEDTILAISGVKTLVKLARINGVIIQSAFSMLKDNVKLYTPSEWKANSLDGLNGSSPKWKIQLEVCRHYKLCVKGNFVSWDKYINSKESEIKKLKNNYSNNKIQIDKIKKILKRKRNPIKGREKTEYTNKIKTLESEYKSNKKEYNKVNKSIKKELERIGNDIYSQTGISSDISDSICIAYALFKDLSV